MNIIERARQKLRCEETPVNTLVDLSGDGGVRKRIISEGVGEEFAKPGSVVAIRFIGKIVSQLLLLVFIIEQIFLFI